METLNTNPSDAGQIASEIAKGLKLAYTEWKKAEALLEPSRRHVAKGEAGKILQDLASAYDCTDNNPAYDVACRKCLPAPEHFMSFHMFKLKHLKVVPVQATPAATTKVEEDKILEPEKKHHGGRATIKVDLVNKQVTASYEKDDAFINNVKPLGFTWNSDKKVWVTRAIGTDTLEDIAAEAGSKLLESGFAISVAPSIATKILVADWKPSTKRYVGILKDGSQFAIRWFGFNDTLYQASRKIRGSKWNSPYVTVPVANYLDVVDFAQRHGFTILASSQKAMDAERARTAEAIKVDVASLRKPSTATTKDDSKVIDDLKD